MKKVYACYLKDENELLKSSSGGAFTAISNVVLNQGGLVIGCTYDYSIHELGFSQAGNYNARNEMRGSKYIQANPLNVYRILEELRESKETSPLLIIGTPCQIAGIKSWINLKKPNLNKSIIYCDILCHGVSSPWIWKNYIKKVEKENNSSVSFLTFKNKERGWIRPTAKGTLANGKQVLLEDYALLYRSDNFMRDSCYKCVFSSSERISDITIGDFWNINNVNPDFYNYKGVSMILVNSQKGSQIFQQVKEYLNFIETSIEDAYQPNLESPTKKGKSYNDMIRDFRDNDLQYVIDKYIYFGYSKGMIRKIKKKFRQIKYGG